MDIKCENVAAGEIPELIDMISDAFKYPDPDKISRDFPLFYRAANRNHLWVVRDQLHGEPCIASHAGSLLLNIYVEGMKVAAGGIGGVASRSDFRGKGYARALVEKCIEDLRSQGATLAFLWSGEHDFFRALGFELVGRQWAIELKQTQLDQIKLEASRACAEQGAKAEEWEILEGPKHILAEGKTLLDQHPLRVERSQEDFKTLVSCPGARVFSAKRNGLLSAYLVVGKGMDLKNHIHEWAGSEIALLLLLAHAMETMGEDLVLLSPQFTPKEAPLIYRLEKLGFSASPGYMSLVKLLNFAKLKELVVQKALSLSMEPSFIRFEKMDDNTFCLGWALDPDIYMNERELMQFVFGPELPSAQVELLPNSKTAFDAIFPLRLWWWGLDSV